MVLNFHLINHFLLYYNLIFVSYTYIAESGNEFNAFCAILPDGDKDVCQFAMKINGEDKFKSEATIERSKMTENYIIPLSSAKAVKGYFSEDSLNSLKTEIQSNTTCLGLALLDKVMMMMTDNVWDIADLAYVNLYK